MGAIFGHDFRQVSGQSRTRQKFRQGGTWCKCNDQIRGWHNRIHGTQRTAQTAPDLWGVIDRQVRLQTLSDAAELNMHMVGAPRQKS